MTSLGRVGPVDAANGDTMAVGGMYGDSALTGLTNSANDIDVFLAASEGNGVGVGGMTSTGIGVYGDAPTSSGPSKGVLGEIELDVPGHANIDSVPLPGATASPRAPRGSAPVGNNLAATGDAIDVRGSRQVRPATAWSGSRPGPRHPRPGDCGSG